MDYGMIFICKSFSIITMTQEERGRGQHMPGPAADTNTYNTNLRAKRTEEETGPPIEISSEHLRIILTELYIDIS
jgi:hypothetical protein